MKKFQLFGGFNQVDNLAYVYQSLHDEGLPPSNTFLPYFFCLDTKEVTRKDQGGSKCTTPKHPALAPPPASSPPLLASLATRTAFQHRKAIIGICIFTMRATVARPRALGGVGRVLRAEGGCKRGYSPYDNFLCYFLFWKKKVVGGRGNNINSENQPQEGEAIVSRAIA